MWRILYGGRHSNNEMNNNYVRQMAGINDLTAILKMKIVVMTYSLLVCIPNPLGKEVYSKGERICSPGNRE